MSAVTIRSWERQKLISLPRDERGDRKLSTSDVRAAAERAHELGRISENRLHLINAAVTMLSIIEDENK